VDTTRVPADHARVESARGSDGPELFQVSTLAALAHGDNRGRVPIRTLLAHGDLGIGTFDHLDGELVVVDGAAYRVHGHEEVAEADGDELTPYAAVTRFAPGAPARLPECAGMAALTAALDALRADDERVVAIRLDGLLRRVRIRVACGASEGERLAHAAGRQFEAEHRDVEGTLVGFWSPASLLGVDVVGYHLHLISSDRTIGGHVYDVEAPGLEARLQAEDSVTVTAAPPGPVDADVLARDLGTAEEGPG
jgi:acetolactate decarboxylase